jgi:predicted nucleotidyltransferase
MKSENLDQIIVSVKRWFAEQYQDGLASLILYGSQARGDAKEDSDVDLLIVLKRAFDYREELEKTSHFVADLSLEYDTVISRAFVSVDRYQRENSPFFLNVRREGIVL